MITVTKEQLRWFFVLYINPKKIILDLFDVFERGKMSLRVASACDPLVRRRGKYIKRGSEIN